MSKCTSPKSVIYQTKIESFVAYSLKIHNIPPAGSWVPKGAPDRVLASYPGPQSGGVRVPTSRSGTRCPGRGGSVSQPGPAVLWPGQVRAPTPRWMSRCPGQDLLPPPPSCWTELRAGPQGGAWIRCPSDGPRIEVTGGPAGGLRFPQARLG